MEFVPDYYVYTDGSCVNNGKPNARAGMGVYFGPDDSRNVSRLVEGKQSNNTAELGALLEAYKIIERDVSQGKKVMIVADSTYAIRAATTYGEKCAKKGWIGDIPNKLLVQEAYALFKDQPNIQFMQVLGHTGKSDVHSVGNDGADRLANQAIGLESCPYATDISLTPKPSKIYLNVPFARKEEAKPLGAMWDVSKKRWYIMDNNVNKEKLIGMFGL